MLNRPDPEAGIEGGAQYKDLGGNLQSRFALPLNGVSQVSIGTYIYLYIYIFYVCVY